MPIMVNFMCKNNMLTDITYNSVLIYVQIGRVLNWHYYTPCRPKDNFSGS